MRPLLLALALAAVLGACSRAPLPAVSSAGASRPAGPTLLIAPEDLCTLDVATEAGGPVITGSLQAGRRADLRAEVGALVRQVLKENGEPVRAGELLVRLDDASLRDSLASAEESVRAATRAFEQAERQAQRQKTLREQGMISTQALEDAEVHRNNAQSDLEAARARAAAARQQLRRTEVRAPFDGVVSDRKVSAGDTAEVGKELLNVIDPGSMRFEGLVAADRMHELQVGQAVRFRVNGYSQGDFAGRVRRIDAAVDATTRQVAVIVEFAAAAQAPRVAGLFAEGHVATRSELALVLPGSAVARSAGGAFVWRVDEQAIRKVDVALGERNARSGDYRVLSGLAAGDRVLCRPGNALVDGQAVEFSRALATGSPAASILR